MRARRTLHVLNSAIVKLSKLTVASKVYRGVSGGRLPTSFRMPNDFGVCGGIDSAFMSTTLDRDEAMRYAASTDGPAVVFEIQQGMVDRGADIGWLSQYPHERELLFAPLTGLEVQRTSVEGSVVVVVLHLSINLTALTIEQVLGKRKKLLVDMVPGLKAELKQALRDEGIATSSGEDFLADKLTPRIKAGPLRHKEEWYNVDSQFKAALDAILKLRRELGPGGTARVDVLMSEHISALAHFGFGAHGAITADVANMLRALESTMYQTRVAAVRNLGKKLQPPALAVRAAAVVAMLEDSAEGVRRAAVETLSKLDTPALATHAAAIFAMLEHSDDGVRLAATQTLRKLDAPTLATHAAAIVAMLEHSDDSMRSAAAETLRKLDALTLATHAAAIVAMLEHSDDGVRRAAVETLGKLDAPALATHAAAIVAMLEHSHGGVRRTAVETLGGLDAPTLAVHAATIIAKLEHSYPRVRLAAVEVLLKFDAPTLTPYADVIVTMLEHPDGDVRRAALKMLGKLGKDVLTALQLSSDARWQLGLDK